MLAACRSTPPPGPLVAPRLQVEVRHYAGSPLSGPRGGLTVAQRTEGALATCRVIYIESMPIDSGLEPLSAHTRLIGAERGGAPLLSSALLARGALIGVGDSATRSMEALESGEWGRTLELALISGALLDGVSVAFAGLSEDWMEVPDLGAVRKKIELHVSHESEGDPTLALVVEDLAVPRRAEQQAELDLEDESGDLDKVLQRELIVLEERASERPLLLLFHSPFGSKSGAFGVLVQVQAGQGPDFQAALELCREQLGPDEEAGPIDAIESEWTARRTMASALGALEVPRLRRSALLFLASNTEAELTLDLALSAEDAVLSALATALSAKADAASHASAKSLGWMLEREAYSLLSQLQISNPPLPPDLSGILLMHAGEVGRLAILVRQIASQSGSLEAFKLRIELENWIFLEDSNPGARVRAFDWLERNGADMGAYDPLAEESERRLQLARARANAPSLDQ